MYVRKWFIVAYVALEVYRLNEYIVSFDIHDKNSAYFLLHI